jgi:hypothetical protein
VHPVTEGQPALGQRALMALRDGLLVSAFVWASTFVDKPWHPPSWIGSPWNRPLTIAVLMGVAVFLGSLRTQQDAPPRFLVFSSQALVDGLVIWRAQRSIYSTLEVLYFVATFECARWLFERLGGTSDPPILTLVILAWIFGFIPLIGRRTIVFDDKTRLLRIKDVRWGNAVQSSIPYAEIERLDVTCPPIGLLNVNILRSDSEEYLCTLYTRGPIRRLKEAGVPVLDHTERPRGKLARAKRLR